MPYGLEIHDTELATDTDIDFNMPMVGGPTVTYENSEDNIFSEVVPARCTFTMELETVAHSSFYSDYRTASEGRFFVRLYYVDVGSNIVPMFIGKLLHDITSLDDGPYQELTLSAADPLLELVEEDFIFQSLTDSNYNWGYSSFAKILSEYIFKKSKTLQHFYTQDTDTVFHVFNEWRSTVHTDSTDMLSNTYIKDYFRYADSGVVEIRSCLYALGEIMRSLGARIYFDSGVYVIEQLNTRHNNTFTFSKYMRDGTFAGTETKSYTLNHDNKEYFIYANPKYTLLAPIKSVVLEQNGYFKENLIYDLALDQSTINTGTPVQISTVSDLSVDLRVYLRINIRNWVEKYSTLAQGATSGPLAPYDSAWPKFGYFRYAIRVQVGNKYLGGSGTIVYNPVNQSYQLVVPFLAWSDFDTARVRVFIPFGVMFSDLQQNVDDDVYMIDIISPNIEEEGDVFFSMSTSGAYEGPSIANVFDSLDLPHPYLNKLVVTGSTLAIVSNVEDNSDEKGSTITTLPNDLNNSIVHNVRYDMGSFAGTSSNHKIRVHDGTELVDSDEWVHPDLGNMTYQMLAIHDILSFKRIPRDKLYMSMEPNSKSPFRMIHRLLLNGTVYMPLSLSYDTGQDIGEYTWIEIDKQVANIQSPTTVLPVVDYSVNPFVSSTGTTSSLQGGSGAITYYNLVDSAVGDSVDISDYVGLQDPALVTDDSVRRSIKIYMGGTKQRYKDVVKSSLKTGEFRIDFANKLVEWGRDISGRVIEIEAYDNYVFAADIPTA